MASFTDFKNNIIFITSPKCGTTSISEYINKMDVSLEENKEISTDNFTKIIVFRKDIIERFLSGFYEDLFNNSCYTDMNITFNEYLYFLYKCYEKKIPNVNGLSIIDKPFIPIWWGEFSLKRLYLTDSNGKFISHIQSQSFVINHYMTPYINEGDKNIKIIELNDLSSNFPDINTLNKKNRIKNKCNISNIKLGDIKKHRIIISKNSLNNNQVNLILKIYEEDISLIDKLMHNYEIYKTI